VQKCTKTNVRRRYSGVGALREALFEVLQQPVTFSSQEEEEVVQLLQQKESLTEQEWDRVFQQIDENVESDRSNHTIFRALKVVHIDQLATDAPDLLASLGKDYATYAQNQSFDFDYCDVIATRAEAFYLHGEMDLRAAIALAMLELGTSHNRWFVERKFVQMAGPSISNELAERIATEVEIQEIDFKRKVRHLELSIRVGKDSLHPVLAKLAEEADEN
jgi:hypothetical protein